MGSEMPERVWLSEADHFPYMVPIPSAHEYILASKHAEIVAALTKERDELMAELSAAYSSAQNPLSGDGYCSYCGCKP